MEADLVDHLQRQSTWLRESWLWILKDKGIINERTALEVGCGAGHAMEILSQHFDIKGMDKDQDMVDICNSKGLAVQLANVEDLPYDDDSFDIVYCSFLMLWLRDPGKALKEMARVSRSWIICLGEPDYGGRIDFPTAIENLGQHLINDLRDKGADPFIGRKLRKLFSEAGLEVEIGIHQGVWPLKKLQNEINNELVWISETERTAMLQAIENSGDSLFQYNPVFYAMAKK